MVWLVRLASVAAALGFCFGIDMLTRTGDALAIRLVTLAGLYVTLAVSLNLINGITGQFSIGHAAFYQVGAYTGGYISATYAKGLMPDKDPVMAAVYLIGFMILGALAAGLAGLIVGLPSLRLKGDYLAIVTLGFGEIIRIVVQNTQQLGGSYGLNVTPKIQMIWLVWLLAIICIAVCRNLLKSAHGLPFLAVREDEIAASAMGVNLTKVKVTAFVIGSAFAGAAGALLANFEVFITPQTFNMDVSFIILTMVVLGGTGSITGSAIAGATLYYLPEKLRDLDPIKGSALVAAIVAAIATVATLKWIVDHFHGTKLKKAGVIIGTVIAGVIIQMILSKLLGGVKVLYDASFEASKLRMVIFAGTLIVLMLLRPQGLFAHHEFSWDWLVRTLKGLGAFFTGRKSQEASS